MVSFFDPCPYPIDFESLGGRVSCLNHGSRDSTAILASLGSVLVSHDPSSQRSVAILDRCQMAAPPPRLAGKASTQLAG